MISAWWLIPIAMASALAGFFACALMKKSE